MTGPQSQRLSKRVGARNRLPRLSIGVAMRKAWAKGYGVPEFRQDLLAGLVVGVVALPLSMALAIGVGVPPQHGLYTAMVAGVVVALLGGCKYQITGPTAAFIVILVPIVSKHGLSGLLTAGFMAGVMLTLMGIGRLGNLISFVPYPVTTGFTAGIATVIGVLQIKDVLGLRMGPMPEHFPDKVMALVSARSTWSLAEALVAAVTFGLLLVLPRVTKRIPAPLLALAAVAGGVVLVRTWMPGLEIATIGSRFRTTIEGVEYAGIPPFLPTPKLPWHESGLSFGLIRELLPSAFAIAVLGAIESLLSAVVADGMTGTKHEPNSEILALGIGNMLAPIFGGIAATGALARTATNIRAGAKSPLSSVVHAAVVLLAILLVSRLVAFIPMASLAALLVLVAYNMSDIRHFMHLARVAPKSDVFVMVTCLLLTVIFDMVIAVSVGFVLAAILFMRRMASLTEGTLRLDGTKEGNRGELPEGVALYEVNGPLFFGAAQSAMATLDAIESRTIRVIVLSLGNSMTIDASGLVALENAIAAMGRKKRAVVIAGPLPRPRSIFQKARLSERFRGVRVTETLEEGLALARDIAEGKSPNSAFFTPTPLPVHR